MRTTLRPHFLHRLATSPVGILFETRTFDYLLLRLLRAEYSIRRAAVTAQETLGGGVGDFLRKLGAPRPPSAAMRQRLDAALAGFARACLARDEAAQRWEEAFWGGSRSDPEKLVALERERRRTSELCVRGAKHFGFLAWAGLAPVAEFRTPRPEDVHSAWGDAIAHPEHIYSAPAAMPTMETSARMRGRAGVEYLIRFPSPSVFTKDLAYAKVFEPRRACAGAPALVYAGGLGVQYDQETYWPEEECLGRRLSAVGWRVILIESPWHGRRTPPGFYSGEAYLVGIPVTGFQLFSAQAQETAVLIEWARSMGARTVVVGGMSLGGVAACQVAGRCGRWPAPMRPDWVAPIGFSSPMHKLLAVSTLGEILGMRGTLAGAGWTEEDLQKLGPVLDPPDALGIPPARMLAFLGVRDDVAPYRLAVESLRVWGVPERNITRWDAGHINVVVELIRRWDYVNAIRNAVARGEG